MSRELSRRNFMSPAETHDTVHITGLVVHARAEYLGEVLVALRRRRGIEIHAHSPVGKIVVTLEAPSDEEIVQALGAIGDIPGVLSTALVYQRFERA